MNNNKQKILNYLYIPQKHKLHKLYYSSIQSPAQKHIKYIKRN